jgi:hypothetical protein
MPTAAAAGTAYYEIASPTLLVQQKVEPPVEPQKEQKNWQRVYAHLESRLQMLRNWRYAWWVHWSWLAQFFQPQRYVWLVVANRMWRGNPINDQIIDSTGLLAVQTCASGMWSGLTNPARPWLKLGPALPWVELDADGKDWYEDAEERLYTVLAQSNWYRTMAQAFADLTVFGTAPVVIYQHYQKVIHCFLPCAGEYYNGLGADLDVDTLYREFTYTVAQIVEFFGYDNCPQNVQRAYLDGGEQLDSEYVVAHAIEPNFQMTRKGRGSDDAVFSALPSVFAYREIYWLRGQKDAKPLSMRGFHTRPFMGLMWKRRSFNDAYGHSPCMEALGDSRQVQMETREKGEYIKKLTKPPMLADPSLKNEPSSIQPGNITYVTSAEGRKGFSPAFEVAPAALAPMIEDIKQVNERIKACLKVDVFMAITQMAGVQPRNELELTKRDLERLQSLGPVIDLVEGELAVGLHRILDIMQRMRLLKPKPKSIANIPLKIEFISLMRIAQRSALSVSMKDTFATMGELSTAAKAAGVPDPIRVFNLDKSARKYADVTNYPSDCLFTEDEVLKHDQARAKASQQVQTPQNISSAVDAAKSLSDTKIAPDNALGQILGQRAV